MMPAPGGASIPPNPIWWNSPSGGGINQDGLLKDFKSKGLEAPLGSEDREDAGGNGSGSGSGSGAAAYAPAEEGSTSTTDDRLGGAAADRVSVGDGCSESSQPRPTLQKDGPVNNVGSAGHPDNCKPCAFYCFSLRGCRNANECAYCHLFHESKLRQRREEWKKSQREKRGKQRPQRSEQPLLAEALNEAEASSDARSAAEALPATRAARTVEIVPPSLGQVPKPSQARMESAEESQWLSRHGVRAQRRVPEASMPTAADAVAAPMRTPTVRWCNENSMPLSVALGIGRNMPTNQMPMRQPQPQPQPQPQRHPVVQPQLDAAAGQPRGPLEEFTYIPNTAAISVGQAIELWPPMHMVSAGMVFAVSPDLPRGLMLDERLGLVHGKAQEGTQGMVKYYITACEPGDRSLSVKIAVVGLKVIETHAHAHKTRPACEMKWVSSTYPHLASVA